MFMNFGKFYKYDKIQINFWRVENHGCWEIASFWFHVMKFKWDMSKFEFQKFYTVIFYDRRKCSLKSSVTVLLKITSTYNKQMKL